MSVTFSVVIPARYASTRLPGKPLSVIAGRALVHHVHDVAVASGAHNVVVATDDVRIENYCLEHELAVCMTAAAHQSGTDRCAEVANVLGWSDESIVVNLQGDEPLVPSAHLSQTAGLVTTDAMATLAAPIRGVEHWQDPNRVKVVCDANGRALYFSRAPIPAFRDDDGASLPPAAPLHHIGIYAYSVGMLRRLTALPPCALERTESLEQLRALFHGVTIRVAVVDEMPEPGVDTPEDLARVAARLESAAR